VRRIILIDAHDVLEPGPRLAQHGLDARENQIGFLLVAAIPCA
jgi:hypothetical protein